MNVHHLTCGLLAAAAGIAGAGAPPIINLSIGTLPVGKSVIISHAVTVDSPTTAVQVSSQANVSGDNFGALLSDDPDTGAADDPTVTGVQQPPIVADIVKAGTEDTPFFFAAADFDAGFNDPNPGDSLEVLRITSLPSKGTLKLGGSDVTATPTDIPRASIGTLAYSPALNENGADSFGWTASDGVVYSGSSALVNINLAAVNDPPGAGTDTVVRHPTQSIKIPEADLLANDTDPEGNVPLTIVGVSSPTANGAIVTRAGGRVFYNPNGHTGTDTIEYTVRDSLGAPSTGTVNVNLINIDDVEGNGPNLVSLTLKPDGSLDVLFAGIPGRVYRVEKSDTLSPPNWVDCGPVTTDALGRILFNDSPPLPAQRFYRTVYP